MWILNTLEVFENVDLLFARPMLKEESWDDCFIDVIQRHREGRAGDGSQGPGANSFGFCINGILGVGANDILGVGSDYTVGVGSNPITGMRGNSTANICIWMALGLGAVVPAASTRMASLLKVSAHVRLPDTSADWGLGAVRGRVGSRAPTLVPGVALRVEDLVVIWEVLCRFVCTTSAAASPQNLAMLCL